MNKNSLSRQWFFHMRRSVTSQMTLIFFDFFDTIFFLNGFINSRKTIAEAIIGLLLVFTIQRI